MAKTRCLSETTLRLFNNGQVSLPDINQIAGHLETCNTCLAKLEALEPGPLELGMRSAAIESVRPEGDDNSRIDSNAQRVLESVFPETSESLFSHRGCDVFRLGEQIGTTSIGRVYLSTDLVMDRRVRIIIPHEGLIASIDHRAQLIHDGNNASWLKHENILRVIQFGAWDESRCYFAMPVIKGWSLARIIESGIELDLFSILQVFGQICQSLKYAHSQNVVHRHLNPTNIYIDEGLQVSVSEFGLTLDGRYQFGLIEPLANPTRYNSPESIRNEPHRIDFRTDIFSTGAILDSLLDLSPGLDGKNMETLREIAQQAQRNSRRKRFQTMDQVINEIGERIHLSS